MPVPFEKEYPVIMNHVSQYGGYLDLIIDDVFVEITNCGIYRYGYNKSSKQYGWIYSYCIDDIYQKEKNTLLSVFVKKYDLKKGVMEYINYMPKNDFLELHSMSWNEIIHFLCDKFSSINKLDFGSKRKLYDLEPHDILRVLDRGFFFTNKCNPSAIVMARIKQLQ